ncbi:hypothetical protein HDU76_007297, partial [Blyttiomyces sp. JEL0837]
MSKSTATSGFLPTNIPSSSPASVVRPSLNSTSSSSSLLRHADFSGNSSSSYRTFNQ